MVVNRVQHSESALWWTADLFGQFEIWSESDRSTDVIDKQKVISWFPGEIIVSVFVYRQKEIICSISEGIDPP